MKKKYAIKEIGNLGLGYKTMISKIIHNQNGIDIETQNGELEDGLEIYIWDDNREYRCTIASFDLNKRENTFELREIGDRMANPAMDWNAFGELVVLGHDMLMRTEEELD